MQIVIRYDVPKNYEKLISEIYDEGDYIGLMETLDNACADYNVVELINE